MSDVLAGLAAGLVAIIMFAAGLALAESVDPAASFVPFILAVMLAACAGYLVTEARR